ISDFHLSSFDSKRLARCTASRNGYLTIRNGIYGKFGSIIKPTSFTLTPGGRRPGPSAAQRRNVCGKGRWHLVDSGLKIGECRLAISKGTRSCTRETFSGWHGRGHCFGLLLHLPGNGGGPSSVE